MSEPILIVPDIPTPEPGLGFAEYVEALADAIRGGRPAQFTVGLYGAWGSGKSSLLAAIERTLSEDGDVRAVPFDAWRHEGADHIVVPLLHRIAAVASASGQKDLAKKLRRAMAALLFSLNFDVAGVGIDAQAVRDNWEAGALTPLDDAFSKPFEELRELSTTLGRQRIVVLVDDLDRCSPGKVVSLLEAINVVMDVPGFIFVLALDYNVLVAAVEDQYKHVSGHAFIEKMVQVPFRVPPLRFDSTKSLNELIPDWQRRKAGLDLDTARTLTKVAEHGLSANPRQIKRLVNSFLLLARIADRRQLSVSRHFLAALLGLQLRWPWEFQELQQRIIADSDRPFGPLLDAEDESLKNYAVRFFSDSSSRNTLLQVMQLTAVFAEPPGPGLQGNAKARLADELASIGFRREPAADWSWKHSRLSDFRVVLRSDVRFDVFNPEDDNQPWQPIARYRYSKVNEILDALEKRLDQGKSATPDATG